MVAESLLRAMLRIRIIEETLACRYAEQEMRTPVHFSIGQEGPAVGVCAALRLDDAAYSNHRCHAHYLAKGGNLQAMVSELYGRVTGCCGGRGGSVHLNDPSVGMIASAAILGETIATAVGSAWAYQMDGLDRVAAAFFGDSCVEEGVFHESLNFAAVMRVPVLFVCENNLYSVNTPLSVRQPRGVAIWQRAQSYGMPAKQVDGNDVFAVRGAAEEAVAWCRAGNGPYFLECLTYRWREHVGPQWDPAVSRPEQEVAEWLERCPVKRAIASGGYTREQVTDWGWEYQAEIDAAIETARTDPWPAVESMLVGVTG